MNTACHVIRDLAWFWVKFDVSLTAIDRWRAVRGASRDVCHVTKNSGSIAFDLEELWAVL